MHRQADGAALVGNGTGDGLAYPPGGIGRKLEAFVMVKLVSRFHQADIAFLDQVEQRQATPDIPAGYTYHEAQVSLHEPLLGVRALIYGYPALAAFFLKFRLRDRVIFDLA